MNFRLRTVVRGYTLIEVIITLFLVIGVSGIAFHVFRQTTYRIKVSQTQTLLQLLEYSLEQYALDHDGIYPAGDGSYASAQILYQKLAGYTPEGVRDESARCYGEYLSPRGRFVEDERAVVDSFGNYIRYIAPYSENSSLKAYRLWSLASE